MQLEIYSSHPYLTWNPQMGEPFWGYRTKQTLSSNPYCPTLEYTHLNNMGWKWNKDTEQQVCSRYFYNGKIVENKVIENFEKKNGDKYGEGLESEKNVSYDTLIGDGNWYMDWKDLKKSYNNYTHTPHNPTSLKNHKPFENSGITKENIDMYKKEMNVKKARKHQYRQNEHTKSLKEMEVLRDIETLKPRFSYVIEDINNRSIRKALKKNLIRELESFHNEFTLFVQ